MARSRRRVACLLIQCVLSCSAFGQGQPAKENPIAIAALQKLGAELIRDKSGLVRFIQFPESATDADLKHLSGLPHLFAVYVSRSKITDAGLVHLMKLPELRGVQLKKTKVTNAGIRRLKKNKMLDWLDVSGTSVTTAGLQPLSQSLKLKIVVLSEARKTNSEASRLRERSADLILVSSTRLRFNRDATITNVFGVRADTFQNKKGTVWKAEMKGPEVHNKHLAKLDAYNDMKVLDISDSRVTGQGLNHLSKFTDLRVLNLSGTNLKNQFLFGDLSKFGDPKRPMLSALKNLEELNLSHTRLTDDGLVYIEHLVKLKKLNLSHTNVTDLGIPQLLELKNLRRLYLANTKITKKSILLLKECLPNCKIFADVSD